MLVKEILARKPAGVTTIAPDQTLQEASDSLAKHNIGALIVVDLRGQPVGILSERDVVRAMAKHGAECMNLKVADAMTKKEMLIIAVPDDNIDYLSQTMTHKRIRHLPIMENQELVGIISIGDVVKAQIEHLEVEARTLMAYITGG
jgi:CBS domain-containing protein